MIERILIFGNDIGVPQSLHHIPSCLACGIVAAEIRPHEHEALRELARGLQLPIIIQPRGTSMAYTGFIEQIRQLDPDLIFVNSYSMLLRPEILVIPRYGAVNIHGALLPQYRGPNPTQWALLNDETVTGVTMHYMDEHFDTGDIIAQRRVPIHVEDTWRDIQARITVETEKMLADELPKLLAGLSTRQPQDESRAKSWHRRHPEDGMIDWGQSVRYVHNLVRALVKPLPGAFYMSASGTRIFLDKYMTIPQVSALKYSVGKQVLQADHTALTPIALDDLPSLMPWVDDPGQMLSNAPYQAIPRYEHKAWFNSIQERNDMVVFGVRLLQDNRLIGSCQLHSISHVHRSAELQIRIGDPSQRGRGYGTEAVRLLLRFAFKDLNLHRVCLHVFSTNAAAIALYERAGFVREGLLRKAAHIDGAYVDVIVMGILREEYEG